MMTLRERLRQSRDAIIQRWFEGILATYPADSSAVFRDQEDPFANPVGRSLRVGTRGIFDALLQTTDAETVGRHLEEIIKIRAVQQLSASQAVSFVFQLKEVIRAELGESVREPRLAAELVELDGKIDGVALTAFDVFVQCREQVYQLRVNEAKRRVSWVVDKLNQRGVGLEPAPVDPG
jgi:hypothetical protein